MKIRNKLSGNIYFPTNVRKTLASKLITVEQKCKHTLNTVDVYDNLIREYLFRLV